MELKLGLKSFIKEYFLSETIVVAISASYLDIFW